MLNVILIFVQQFERSFLDLTKGDDIWTAVCYLEVEGGHSMAVVVCTLFHRHE